MTKKRKKHNSVIFSFRKLAGFVGILVFLGIVTNLFILKTAKKPVIAPVIENHSYQNSPSPNPITDNAMVTVIPAEQTNSLKTFVHDRKTGFPPFSVEYPSSWTLQNEIRNIDGSRESSTILFTKGEYELRVYQAPVGGSWCIFEGQMPEGMYRDLRSTPYTQLDASIGIFRRIKVNRAYYSDRQDLISFTFCSTNPKQQNDYTTYDSPTLIGEIVYTVPKQYDEATLQEMDSIIKSITATK